MSLRITANCDTNDTESSSLVERTSTTTKIPYLNVNFGFFNSYVKNFYELGTLIRKYNIIGFKIKSNILAVYNSASLMIICQEKIVKDFISLYDLCYDMTESPIPLLTPMLAWQGRVKMQLQRSNVLLFFGIVIFSYSIVILFTFFKILDKAVK